MPMLRHTNLVLATVTYSIEPGPPAQYDRGTKSQ